jgi:DNA-directed RNA polymerase specialized sigma24 family protein
VNDALLTAWDRFRQDPDEATAFVAVALPAVTLALANRYPSVHPDDISSAAADAVLAVVKSPDRYDPARLSLNGYLLMIARRKLASRFEQEVRHHRHRIPWDAVELDAADRNEVEDDPLSFDAATLRPALDALTEPERAAFALMRDGERRTAVFAQALGLTDRPADDQTAEVKRVKDRILARLRRAVRGTS